MLFITAALDAGVRCETSKRQHRTPIRAPRCAMTGREYRSTGNATYVAAAFLAGAARQPAVRRSGTPSSGCPDAGAVDLARRKLPGRSDAECADKVGRARCSKRKGREPV
jgi:hypothetical protein